MTTGRQSARGLAQPRASEQRQSPVAAPRVTRAGSFVITGGVLLQAAIAGGFLAGYPWSGIHMLVGIPLVVSALVIGGVGLVGRRARTEPSEVRLTRLRVLVAILATPIVGLVAAGGTRELLVFHIPSPSSAWA